MTGIVIGCEGMVGRAFVAQGLRGLRHAECDVRSAASVELATSQAACDFVVNCAAFTDVDQAETNELEANEVNGTGPWNLARRCAELGIPLVHLSTDHVFSGRSPRPYAVTDEPDPINAYGRSKALGERLVRQSGAQHLIIRTSWVYASWGRNFVLSVRRSLEAGELVKAVDDQFGRPTSAEYLAVRTLKLLAKGARGTYHVTDGGECSRYRLAFEVAGLSGKTTLRVHRCSTRELNAVARRPMCSLLDLTETDELIGPSRVWTDNLARSIAQ